MAFDRPLGTAKVARHTKNKTSPWLGCSAKNSVVEAGWLDADAFHNSCVNGETSNEHGMDFGAEALHRRRLRQGKIGENALKVGGIEEFHKLGAKTRMLRILRIVLLIQVGNSVGIINLDHYVVTGRVYNFSERREAAVLRI